MPGPLHVLLATDLSDTSLAAYHHAFRLALAARGRLDLVHVHLPDEAPAWSRLSTPRDLLVGWGRLDPKDDVRDFRRLGIEVGVHGLPSLELEAPILEHLRAFPPDLLVVGTEARRGLERLAVPSVAEALARHGGVPTLFVPADARPFVDGGTGSVTLRHVVIPAGSQDDLDAAFPAAVAFVDAFEATHVTFHVVHVGDLAHAPQPPDVDDPRFDVVLHVRHGELGPALVEALREADADVAVMVTRGHDSVGDALRGSHTEVVVRNAPCPVLAVPLGG